MRENIRDSIRIRGGEAAGIGTDKRDSAGRAGLLRFLKRCAAAALLICVILLINRSSFTFAKNCVAALGRAVTHNFDWAGVFNNIRDYFMTVWRFWSEVF